MTSNDVDGGNVRSRYPRPCHSQTAWTYQTHDEHGAHAGPQRASGSVLSGSMPSSRIALAPRAAGSAPQRTSPTRVAAAMCGGSISNSAPQVLARVAPAEAVGPEGDVMRRQPARDHVGECLHPVGGGDDRPALVRQDLADVRDAQRLGVGVESVPALGLERIAAQELERRGAVDLGRDTELLGQQVARGEDLLEDRAGADQPGRVRVAARPRAPRRSGRRRAGCPRRSAPRARTGWA